MIDTPKSNLNDDDDAWDAVLSQPENVQTLNHIVDQIKKDSLNNLPLDVEIIPQPVNTKNEEFSRFIQKTF